MLILERVAKAVLHTPGIALVQSVTRPLGTPIKHSSIPFQISAQSAGQVMNLSYQEDRARDLLTQIDQTGKAIDILQRQLSLQQQATMPPTSRCGHSTTPSTPSTRSETTSPTSTTSSGRYATTSTGSTLLRHPVVCGPAIGIRLTRRNLQTQ